MNILPQETHLDSIAFDTRNVRVHLDVLAAHSQRTHVSRFTYSIEIVQDATKSDQT